MNPIDDAVQFRTPIDDAVQFEASWGSMSHIRGMYGSSHRMTFKRRSEEGQKKDQNEPHRWCGIIRTPMMWYESYTWYVWRFAPHDLQKKVKRRWKKVNFFLTPWSSLNGMRVYVWWVKREQFELVALRCSRGSRGVRIKREWDREGCEGWCLTRTSLIWVILIWPCIDSRQHTHALEKICSGN